MHAQSPAPTGISPVTWLRPAVDIAAAEGAARNLLHALGADITTSRSRTPPDEWHVCNAERLTPEPFDLTTFKATTSS